MRLPNGLPYDIVDEARYVANVHKSIEPHELMEGADYTLRAITDRRNKDRFATDYIVRIDSIKTPGRLARIALGKLTEVTFLPVYATKNAGELVTSPIEETGLLMTVKKLLVHNLMFEEGYFVGDDRFGDDDTLWTYLDDDSSSIPRRSELLV